MLATVRSGALMGVDAVVVDVEVDMALSLPFFALVGLPDSAVKESCLPLRFCRSELLWGVSAASSRTSHLNPRPSLPQNQACARPRAGAVCRTGRARPDYRH